MRYKIWRGFVTTQIERPPRTSIKKMKAKLVARLNIPWALETGIVQKIVTDRGKHKFNLDIFIISPTRKGEVKGKRIQLTGKYKANSSDKIIKAINYLVEDGILSSNLSQQEWSIQLALGTIRTRKLYLVKRS